MTRQASGNVARRSTELTGEHVDIGRGADCGINLPDPRVRLVHASIERRGEACYVVATPGAELRINDAPSSVAPLKPGDRIAVGPYDITVEDPPPGKDLALAVELTRPLGNEFAELVARSRLELDTVGLGKRGWSWLLVAVVLAFALGLPLLGALGLLGGTAPPAATTASKIPSETAARSWLASADHFWLSGDISAPHRYFAEDCGACHEKPFVQVRDAACLECHGAVEHHADPKDFGFATFETVACQSCHKEHNGIEPILVGDQSLCATCHATPDDWEAKTESRPANDFGADHPEFRPTVVVKAEGPVFARQMLGGDAPLRELSGLNFNHAKHLDEKGVKHPTKGTIKITCDECHKPEPGGLGMQPIRMEEICGNCHALNFDPSAPEREVPHGKPREVSAMLRDFYADEALKFGIEETPAEEGVRRLPRTQARLSREEAAAALEWARDRARVVAAETIGKRVCKVCHTVIPPQGDDQPWGIAPVWLVDRWLPHANFDHSKHQQVQCADCHDASKSKSAQDVLLPGIAVCRSCHGGEAATDKVPSTCISCHDFHRHGLPPMRGKLAQQS